MKGKTESTFYEKKAYKKLLKEILYLDYECFTPDFNPYLKFYKFLARKPEFASKDVNQFQKLRLWIPDTIVYNEADQPYWIYTNTEGLVCRSEDFYERHVVSKLGNQYSIDEVAAIKKTVTLPLLSPLSSAPHLRRPRSRFPVPINEHP